MYINDQIDKFKPEYQNNVLVQNADKFRNILEKEVPEIFCNRSDMIDRVEQEGIETVTETIQNEFFGNCQEIFHDIISNFLDEYMYA